MSRLDPCSVDFGREAPKVRFEYCCEFWGGCFEGKVSRRIHQKLPPQNSPGNLFGKIPLGFLKPFLDTIKKRWPENGEKIKNDPKSHFHCRFCGPLFPVSGCGRPSLFLVKSFPIFGFRPVFHSKHGCLTPSSMVSKLATTSLPIGALTGKSHPWTNTSLGGNF